MSEMAADKADETFVGWYVVAFLDLLGQQDKLRQISVLPDQGNAEEVAAFKHQVMQMYGPVKALRTFFLRSINTLSSNTGDEKLQEHEKAFIQEFRSCPVYSRTFSDSVIAHVPLRNDLSKYPCRAIYGVLSAAAITFLSCLANGNPIRGGIELGLGFNIETDEIYGPALARAYTIESKVAQYPRVVIGDELVRYLRAIAANPSTDREDMANATVAKACLNLLTQDDDGHAVLDYLGEDIRGVLQGLPDTAQIVLKAYDVVVNASDKLKEQRNTKLGFRYTLLRNYFEARLPSWGIDLSE